jgi:hypothetical protein
MHDQSVSYYPPSISLSSFITLKILHACHVESEEMRLDSSLVYIVIEENQHGNWQLRGDSQARFTIIFRRNPD